MIVTQTTGVVTNDTLLQGSYNLSADPTNSNNLVLVTTHKTNTDFDVSRIYSNNNAASWSSVMRICSDMAGNGNNQDMVWGAYSSTGKYAAVWRDRRANSGAQNQPYKIWGVYSGDGGNTFSADFQISQSDGPLMIPVDGNDFLGCALNDTVIYSTWTDKRNTSQNQLFINKYKISQITGLKNQEKISSEDIIYPNPNNGSFTLKFERKGEKKIEIFDVNGKLVYSNITFADNLQVKITEAKGNYFVKVIDGKETRTLKLVIE
jgi:hypothetical protein